MKILIADDNIQITNILKAYAEKDNFQVKSVHDGLSAYQTFISDNPDIVLLDVMMPGMNGFEVCKKIRETSTVPIIMVTARGEDFERIMGLDIGADDYIVKPFIPSEVMARIRAILRRITDYEHEKNTVTIDNLFIDLNTYTTKIDNHVIKLTKKEFEILWLLAINQEQVFSRDNILNIVWGYEYLGDTRTVDSHIKRLRYKLDQHNHPRWEVTTIWGVGYKLEVKNHV